MRVRQALYHAMDPDLIVQLAYQGLAEIGQPIPVWLRRYNLPEDKIPQRDVQKAKELLSAAGQANLKFTDKTFQGGANAFGTLQLQQAFKEAGNPYDRKTADAFRTYLLSTGNETDRAEAYRQFRGRDPEVEALLKRRGFPTN